jgi:hypothetical protein
MNGNAPKRFLLALMLSLLACGPQTENTDADALEASLSESSPAPTKSFDVNAILSPRVAGALASSSLGSALGSPVVSSSTCGVANQYAPSCASSSAPDQSYLWTAPFAGTFTFSTLGSGFDTILHIYDAATGATLGCNDDSAGTLQSSIDLTLRAGQQLQLVVDGYSSACGNFALNISGQPSARQCISVPCMPNLARSAVVSVSSTTGSSPSQPDTRWTKERAVDGTRDSIDGAYGWSSMYSGSEYTTEWIQFDFGGLRSVNEAQLYARNDATYGTALGDGFPRDFVIEVSQDGASWSTVVSQTNYPVPQTELQSFSFPSVLARFLRIRATRLDSVGGGGYNLQLAEVEIYDNPGGVAYTFSNGEQAHLSLEQGEALTSDDIAVASATELDSLFTEYQAYLDSAPASAAGEEGVFDSFSAGVNTNQRCKFWQIGCWKRKLIDPRWSGRTVSFYFNSNVGETDRQTIRNIVADWNSRSSVQWIEDGSPLLFKVQFKLKNFSGNVCGDSPVGRIGIPQLIRIRPDCVGTRTVQHEMGHAVGLIHEHQRCDRDNYVSVSSNDSNNSKECDAKYTLFGPYDYSSVMHYFTGSGFLPQRTGSVGDASSPGGWSLGCYDRLGINKLYEVAGGPIPTSPEATWCNPARTATVTVSSTTGPSSTQADGRWTSNWAVDGQRNSLTDAYGWSSMASSSPATVQWIQFQFPSQRRVSRVDMYPRNDATYGSAVGDGFPVDFTIDLSSDGTTWTTAVSRTGYPRPTSVQTFEFTAQPARYLRVRATNLRSVGGGSYYFQIAEIETF